MPFKTAKPQGAGQGLNHIKPIRYCSFAQAGPKSGMLSVKHLNTNGRPDGLYKNRKFFKGCYYINKLWLFLASFR